MKDSLSLRLLHLVTRISFWAIVLASIIIIALGIVTMTGGARDIRLGIPATLSLEKEVFFLKDQTKMPVKAEFSAASIEVPLAHLENPGILSIIIMMTIILACIGYIAWNFNHFVGSVRKGKTFHNETIMLLRKSAIGLIILEILMFIFHLIGYYIVQKNFEFLNIDHRFAAEFPSLPIILALVLWVLAHIFTKGKELEDEQKLTV